MIKPKIDCSKLNAISPSMSAADVKARILSGKLKLYGASVTHGGCSPNDPDAAAKQFASFGMNHARFHHTEVADVRGMVAFADSLLSRGVRFSLSLASLLNQEYKDPRSFYPDLYAVKGNAADQLYLENLQRLHPLLSHRGCFLAVLTNEPCWAIQPNDARRFWLHWSKLLKGKYPNVLLSDCSNPDAPYGGVGGKMRPELFAQVAKLYDIATFHIYVSDAAADGKADNVVEEQHWRRVVDYHRVVGKQLIINEFGSYASNPHQGSNTAFVLMECLRRKYSATHYNWCDRPQHDDGGGNPYAILRDRFRQDLTLLGAHLFKYGGSTIEAKWGGDRKQRTSHYSQRFTNGFGDKSKVEVNISKTKRIIWGLDKTKPSQWLVQRGS